VDGMMDEWSMAFFFCLLFFIMAVAREKKGGARITGGLDGLGARVSS